jgi:hypothetical protein
MLPNTSQYFPIIPIYVLGLGIFWELGKNLTQVVIFYFDLDIHIIKELLEIQ